MVIFDQIIPCHTRRDETCWQLIASSVEPNQRLFRYLIWLPSTVMLAGKILLPDVKRLERYTEDIGDNVIRTSARNERGFCGRRVS